MLFIIAAMLVDMLHFAVFFRRHVYFRHAAAILLRRLQRCHCRALYCRTPPMLAAIRHYAFHYAAIIAATPFIFFFFSIDDAMRH